MRHEWHPHPLSGSQALAFRTIRVCEHCLTQQEQFSQHDWGRVVGYYWRPRARRCHAHLRHVIEPMPHTQWNFIERRWVS